MRSRPLVIDLFCGLGGWTRGFLSEGWDAIGFDIERHEYLSSESHFGGLPKTTLKRYPAQLVLQNVLTLDGRQFRGIASMIVASPPCQRYSWMAQPWKRAKREARWQRWERDSPLGDRLESLNALFNAALRIAREAELPIVIENVKGAQPWVGRAKANFGSFFLWGDVARIGNRVVRDCKPVFGMPAVQAASRVKQPGRNFHFPEKYGIPSPSFHGAEYEESVRAALALKTQGHANQRDGYNHTRHLTNQSESDAVKNGGNGSWFGIGSPGQTQTRRESGERGSGVAGRQGAGQRHVQGDGPAVRQVDGPALPITRSACWRPRGRRREAGR